MIKQWASVLGAFFFLVQLQAQTPTGIFFEGNFNRKQGETTLQKAMCNNAGTVTLGPHVGRSNDVTRDTLYLCAGDQILVDHNAGTEDLSGDPDLSTPAGVTYAFYSGRPTVGGPTLAAVAADPNILTINPALLPPGVNFDSPFWVTAHPTASNDVPFINDGNLQRFFNNGNPLLLWFAPITCDGFRQLNLGGVNSFIPRYEGSPAGPCVNVNVDEAFAVVYLNEIVANNIQINQNTGTFQLSGGLPQFDNNAPYNVSITLASNPVVRGIVSNTGSTISVTVPQEGIYNVSVQDGKACPFNFTMTFNFSMNNNGEVTFELPLANIQPNSSRCVDVRVRDFTDVGGFQIPVSWNPFPVRFDSVTNFNPLIPGFNINQFGLNNTQFGELRVAWADIVNFQTVTLPDNAVLFSVCFTARAEVGNCSPLTFELGGVDTIGFSRVVEDRNGLPVPARYIAGQICVSNDPLLLVVDNTNASCTSNSSAFISFLVSDGAAPYTYELRDRDSILVASGSVANAGGRDTIRNLRPGDYTLIVVDSGQPGFINTVSRAVSIVTGVDLGANARTLTQPSCFGLSDGAVTIDIFENSIAVQNPGSDYTFIWRNRNGDTIGNTLILRDLPAGFYEAIISKGGCVLDRPATVTLSQPSPLALRPVNRRDATCVGVNDGFLSIQASGGNTSQSNFYRFQWNVTAQDRVPSAQPVQLGGLVPGNYILTITDDNNCNFVDSFRVNARRTISANATVTDITCFGGEDGRIFVEGVTTGQAAPNTTYNFNWSPLLTGNSLPQDTERSSTISNLSFGNYIVQIEDQDGCTAADTFTVVQPERIQLSFANRRDATCIGGLNDGRLEVAEPIGGTAPFRFRWTSIPNLTSRLAENLTTGEYTVVLTDTNGCMDSLSTVITAPDLPIITTLANDTLNCSSDVNGRLTVQFRQGSSGGAITNILWSNGERGESTTPTLRPGEYSVRITDSNSCFAEASASVIAPETLTISQVRTQSPTCAGGDNGSITLTVTGGTMPYRFFNGQTPNSDNIISNLMSGTYSVRVQDANNCPEVIAEAIVAPAPSIVVEFRDVQPADCALGQGRCTGRAQAIAFMDNGEQRTFDFVWGNGEQNINTINSQAIALCAGMNTITVTDDGNCTVTSSLNIASPPPILPIGEARWVSCFGETDGEVAVNVAGGTPPFSYDWNTGAQVNRLIDLAPNTYTVTITDANDCRFDGYTLTVGEPELLVLRIAQDSTRNIRCAGENNGSIKVSVQGGNGLGGNPFTWSQGIAGTRDSLATNLRAGTYFITVSDQNGCNDTVSYTVTEPMPIRAIIPTPEEPVCFGVQTSVAVTSAMGGNGAPYNFSVNNVARSPLDRVVPVFGGQEVLVSVFDVLGCRKDTTFFINQPPPVEVILPEALEVQLGDSIRLRPDVFSSQPIESIVWTPGDALSSAGILNPTIRPIQSNTYTLRVVDANGCIGEDEIFISVDRKRKVYIPNAFSPSSVFNSTFKVFTGAGVSQVNFIRIYDRWGELVYTADSLSPELGGSGEWDGTFRGQPVQSGTYVYLVEVAFQDNVKLLYRGDITVIY